MMYGQTIGTTIRKNWLECGAVAALLVVASVVLAVRSSGAGAVAPECDELHDFLVEAAQGSTGASAEARSDFEKGIKWAADGCSPEVDPGKFAYLASRVYGVPAMNPGFDEDSITFATGPR